MSYETIGLMTVAVTQDLLFKMPLVLFGIKNAFGTVYHLNQDTTKCSTVETRVPHCMQEDLACNELVVLESLYRMISHLLRYTKSKRWVNSNHQPIRVTYVYI